MGKNCVVVEHANNAMQANNNVRQNNLPNLPVTVRRENTEGLEDKFGKFCLPQGDSRQKYRMSRILFWILGLFILVTFFILLESSDNVRRKSIF